MQQSSKNSWSLHKERATDLSYEKGSFQVNLYKMIRFLSEILKKYTKLAKTVKISILKWNLQPIGLFYEI